MHGKSRVTTFPKIKITISCWIRQKCWNQHNTTLSDWNKDWPLVALFVSDSSSCVYSLIIPDQKNISTYVLISLSDGYNTPANLYFHKFDNRSRRQDDSMDSEYIFLQQLMFVLLNLFKKKKKKKQQHKELVKLNTCTHWQTINQYSVLLFLSEVPTIFLKKITLKLVFSKKLIFS